MSPTSFHELHRYAPKPIAWMIDAHNISQACPTMILREESLDNEQSRYRVSLVKFHPSWRVQRADECIEKIDDFSRVIDARPNSEGLIGSLPFLFDDNH